MGVTCTSRIPLLQTGHSGLAKTKLDGTSVGDCTWFCIGWFSRFALNRAVALLTVQTRPRCEHSPAKAGLQRSLFPGSEKRQKVRRKRNRRNAGAISTQSMFRRLCLPMASVLPTPRSGKLCSTIVLGSSCADDPRLCYVACRVPSTRAGWEIKREPHPTKQTRQNRIWEPGAPQIRATPGALSRKVDTGFRIRSCSNTSDASRLLRGGVPLKLQGSPALPAGGRASPSCWLPQLTSFAN